MTDVDLTRKKSGVRIVVLTSEEADALFKLAAALDDLIPRDHAVMKAADKLDEQVAAQMRNPYDEAKDALEDELSMLDQWQYDQIHFDVLAQRLVDRLLGVYE